MAHCSPIRAKVYLNIKHIPISISTLNNAEQIKAIDVYSITISLNTFNVTVIPFNPSWLILAKEKQNYATFDCVMEYNIISQNYYASLGKYLKFAQPSSSCKFILPKSHVMPKLILPILTAVCLA